MNPLPSRKLNLLVVDDDPSIVRLLTHLVESKMNDSFVVYSFTDPDLACDWLDNNCCDICLSDLQMPGTDGLEILKFAKRRNAWTQVVFMTAYSTWDKITEAIELGASDYLLKPVQQEDLLNLLTQLGSRCGRWQSAVMQTLDSVHA
jgi:DNA-binding NtrC family response regulator